MKAISVALMFILTFAIFVFAFQYTMPGAPWMTRCEDAALYAAMLAIVSGGAVTAADAIVKIFRWPDLEPDSLFEPYVPPVVLSSVLLRVAVALADALIMVAVFLAMSMALTKLTALIEVGTISPVTRVAIAAISAMWTGYFMRPNGLVKAYLQRKANPAE